jgi:hypothetical protein
MRASNIIGKEEILIRVRFLLQKARFRGKKAIRLALKYVLAKLFSKVT